MFKLCVTIKKDFRILLRDKIGIILMFVMPIVLVIVATGIQNSTFQLVNKNRIQVLVCNQDTGKAGKELIADLDKIGMFSVQELPKSQPSVLTTQMHQTDAMLGIVIPSNFSAQVMSDANKAAGKALKSFGLQGDSAKTLNKVYPLKMYYNPVMEKSLQMSVTSAIQSVVQMVESRQTLRIMYFSINEKPLPIQLENEMLNNKAPV